MYRFGQEEVDAIAKVVARGHFMRTTDGTTDVSKFELEWAEKIGTEYALLINSGTSALIASLVGLGIGPGDEVIVPAYTFMATASAVIAVGAIPVIAEIDETLTMDMKDVEKKISKYTKCVIPVHLNGFPCDMDALLALQKKYGFKILEDCCQADGGSYKGTRVGKIGDAGAYSFNHYKIIGVGDGGGMVTDDRTVYERALIYHDGGSAFRPYAQDCPTPLFIGGQLRVKEVSGAFMRLQLQRLDGILADLRRVKKTIMDALADTKIRFAEDGDSYVMQLLSKGGAYAQHFRRFFQIVTLQVMQKQTLSYFRGRIW